MGRAGYEDALASQSDLYDARASSRSESYYALDHEPLELPAVPNIGGREVVVFLGYVLTLQR